MADMSDEERQAKLVEAKAIMEELGNLDEKLDELHASEVRESMQIVELENGLQELKQFVTTSPPDDQLDTKITEINRRFQHIATTYMRERIQEAKKFEEIGAPVVVLIDRLLPLIDTMSVANKDVLRDGLNGNRAKIVATIEGAPSYYDAVNGLINSAHPEDRIITKENCGTKIDEVMEWASQAHQVIVPAGK